MNSFQTALKFILTNFGPVVVFYATHHFFGLKPAIVTSTVFSIAEIVFKLHKKEPITALFKFSAAMTLVFGVIDLYSQQSFLFKYEACVTNLFTGLFFGASLFGEKSVLQELREKQDPSRPWTRDRVAYLRILTVVWTVYFFLKAGAYFWMASHLNLEQGLLTRTILGSASFYALLVVSVVGSKYIFPLLKKWRLLPNP